MSALTVERPRSLVEELFAAPPHGPGPEPAEATVDADAHARGTEQVPMPDPAGPTSTATSGARDATGQPVTGRTDERSLTTVLPPAPLAAPRVRLLAPRDPTTAPIAAGPAAQTPPTLAARVAVLRATDRSPVLEAVDEDRGPEPTADPAHVARAIAHAVVEVLLGRRPVTQLARWVTPGVYETLQGRAALTARVLGGRTSGRGAAVRRVRVCAVEPHVCEAGVVVDDGVRVRAVALRLETHRGTWRTTSLEVG